MFASRALLHRHTGICRYGQSSRSERAFIFRSNAKVMVCANTYCVKKGAMKTLKMLEELLPDGVAVVKHECLDECPMGPNCGVDQEPDPDGYVFTKITNRVANRDDVITLIRSMGLEPKPSE